jgi:hypothetical protein
VVYAQTNRIKSSTWRISNQLGSVLLCNKHTIEQQNCVLFTHYQMIGIIIFPEL